MSTTTRISFLAAIAALASTPAVAAESPIGVWLDDTGRGAVEIIECGPGKLCGKLVWLQDAKNAKACGTPIIGDVQQAGESWDGGWIYSPEKKSKYDVELTRRGDQLTVLGYAGTKLFSKEMTWTRAPANLVRCDQQQAKAAPPPAPATPTTTQAAATPPPRPTSAADDKAQADAWASEPGKNGATQTAEADVGSAAATAPAKKPARKRETCRVEAPFVTVDFPCDDD
jgi:uncharacterized protein (DUF2147 family)